MLVIWLFYFSIGCLLGRSPWLGGKELGFHLQYLVVCFSLVWLCLRKFDAKIVVLGIKIFVASLAIAWGYQNTAPIAQVGKLPATVIQVAYQGPFQGPLIASYNGRKIEAYGPQILGSVGTLLFRSEKGLFASGRSELRPQFIPEARCENGAIFCQLAMRIRNFVIERLMYIPPHLQGWIAGLLLGERSQIQTELKDAFKKSGVIHLLSVSGLHVTALVFALSCLLRVPGQTAYALRLISPLTWRRLAAVLSVLAAVSAWLYAALTGMSSAAQRAMFVFATNLLLLLFEGQKPLSRRLLRVGFLQSFFLPQNFLSEANFMSWTGYLLLARHMNQKRAPGWGSKLKYLFLLQLKLMVLAATFFSQISLPSLVLNLIFLPFFPIVFGSAMLAVLWPNTWPTQVFSWFLAIQETFLTMLRFVRQLCSDHAWLYVGNSDSFGSWRWLFVMFSAILILNTCKELTISKEDKI
jgi:hypothetical protein